jgi:hypothetical protein
MATVKERLDNHDKEIAAIQDLIQQGARLAVQSRKDIRELTAAQKKTDAVLRAFIAERRVKRPRQP